MVACMLFASGSMRSLIILDINANTVSDVAPYAFEVGR